MFKSTGQLTEGMIAPGETFVLLFPIPEGLNVKIGTTALSLAVDVVNRIGGKVTMSAWTFDTPETGWIRATYLPNGREFKAGPVNIYPTLTIDGVAYRYGRISEMVGEWR